MSCLYISRFNYFILYNAIDLSSQYVQNQNIYPANCRLNIKLKRNNEDLTLVL